MYTLCACTIEDGRSRWDYWHDFARVSRQHRSKTIYRRSTRALAFSNGFLFPDRYFCLVAADHHHHQHQQHHRSAARPEDEEEYAQLYNNNNNIHKHTCTCVYKKHIINTRIIPVHTRICIANTVIRLLMSVCVCAYNIYIYILYAAYVCLLCAANGPSANNIVVGPIIIRPSKFPFRRRRRARTYL